MSPERWSRIIYVALSVVSAVLFTGLMIALFRAGR